MNITNKVWIVNNHDGLSIGQIATDDPEKMANIHKAYPFVNDFTVHNTDENMTLVGRVKYNPDFCADYGKPWSVAKYQKNATTGNIYWNWCAAKQDIDEAFATLIQCLKEG